MKKVPKIDMAFLYLPTNAKARLFPKEGKESSPKKAKAVELGKEEA